MSTQGTKKVSESKRSKTPPIPPPKRKPAPGRRAGRLTNPKLDLPADLAELKPEWLKFQKHRMERPQGGSGNRGSGVI